MLNNDLELVGKTEEEAAAILNAQGGMWRVRVREGVSSAGVADHHMQRKNLVIEDGKVKVITYG